MIHTACLRSHTAWGHAVSSPCILHTLDCLNSLVLLSIVRRLARSQICRQYTCMYVQYTKQLFQIIADSAVVCFLKSEKYWCAMSFLCTLQNLFLEAYGKYLKYCSSSDYRIWDWPASLVQVGSVKRLDLCS